MAQKIWIALIAVLFIVILVLAWLLFATPKPTTTAPVATSTPDTSTPTDGSQPLHDRVVVSGPTPGSTVGHTFTVTGEAPGNWFFEASFPIKVRTPDGETLATAIAEAQSDWMTSEQVPFSATVTIAGTYSGPATLALLKDNPSGLPEHEDSLELPIVVQ